MALLEGGVYRLPEVLKLKGWPSTFQGHLRLAEALSCGDDIAALWDNRWRSRWIQFKLNTDSAGDALLWLQGQSIDKINWQLGKMTKGEVGQLAAAAASQSGIGPDLKGFLDQWLQGKPLRRSQAL